MTILVMGTIKVAAGDVTRLIDAMTAQAAASNAEEGCDHYSFAVDVGDPNLVHIAERWASEDALTAHFAMPHMKTFNEAIRGVKIERVEVDAWNGAYWRRLLG